MMSIFDKLCNEVAELPDTNRKCKVYNWEGRPISNKELKQHIKTIASNLSDWQALHPRDDSSVFYTSIPISVRVI